MGDAGSGEAEQPYFWLLTEQRAAAYTFKVQRELKAEQQGVAGAQAEPAAVQEVQAEVERVQIDAIELLAAAILQAMSCSAADVPAFLERRGLAAYASGAALQAACSEALLAVLQHGQPASAPPRARGWEAAAASSAPGSAESPEEGSATCGEGESEEAAVQGPAGAAGPNVEPGEEAAANGSSEQQAGAASMEDRPALDLGQQAAEAVAVHGVAVATARLLQLGAQAGYERRSDGATPLVAALLGGHTEAAEHLLDAGAPADPPAQAASPPRGRGDADASPVDSGSLASKRKFSVAATPAAPDVGSEAAAGGGPTPLVLAAAAGSLHLVDRLLAAGAQPRRRCLARVSVSGRSVALTPLIAAVNAGSEACVARLLAAGADLHHKCAVAHGGGASADWTSALSAAVLSGNAGMVRALVEAGACTGQHGGAAVGQGHPALRAVALAAARGGCDMLDVMYPPLAAGLAGGSGAMIGTLKRRTALHPLAAAAERGQLAAVERLLELGAPAGHGASVVAGVAQHTPLMLAAANGHVKVVRCLLAAGACPLSLNAQGRSAAALALAAGQLEVLRLLLGHAGELAELETWSQAQQVQQAQQQQAAAGAGGLGLGGTAPPQSAVGGTQPLCQASNASKAWQTGFVAGLLPRQRPLTLAALDRERQRYQLLLAALLAAHAQGGGPDAPAAAAVRVAATPAALAHAAAGSGALLDAVLRCGASLACVDPASGAAPLLAACSLGWPAMLRLLRRGADPNQADASGRTPLMALACRPGATDALAAFLCWDAERPAGSPRLDLGRLDGAGRDVVGVAVAARNRAAAEQLLTELAARQEAVAAASRAARQQGQQQGGEVASSAADVGTASPRPAGAPCGAAGRAYDLLLAQGALCLADINRPAAGGGQHPLLAAAAASTRRQVLQVLQLPGIDAGARDAEGRTALLLAAARQQPVLVADLAGSGRVDLEARDAAGCTALLLAARGGSAAVVRVLLEAGADVSAVDREGTTALMALAANGQHKLLAEVLRSANPPPIDARDARGWTSLQHAAAAGSFNACKVLLGWGADAGLRAGEGGPTAVELAESGGHASCVPVLQRPPAPPL